MADSWYFFHQEHKTAPWVLALASERARINRDVKPELNTVLDLNYSFEVTPDAATKAAIKYRGDFYIDLDSKDIPEVIGAFKELLTNFKAKEVNLDALRLYCSGSKGFHIEVPAAMFEPKAAQVGVPGLPLIYREVAQAVYVNTIDLRVYSQGSGRQWRQANVKRDNGCYKVQITATEAFAMTAERYAELIHHPRPVFPVESAVFNPYLALEYCKAKDKIEHSIKARAKIKPKDDQLKRFEGKWPKTLQTILSGNGLKPNVGFNYIAVQLATTASALDKSEDEFIADCQPLIQTYQGDSKRYGTAALKEKELRDKWAYFTGNPCYEFGVGAILSMVDAETKAATDLNDGDLKAEPTVDGAPQPEAPFQNKAGLILVNKKQICTKKDNQWKEICDVGLDDITLLKTPTGKIIGYDATSYPNGGETKPKQLTISLNDLLSKLSMHQLMAREHSTAFLGTDVDAAHLMNYLRDRVIQNKAVSLVTQVEGVDLIIPPGAKSKEDVILIWSSGVTGVVANNGSTNFVYRPSMLSAGSINSDLWDAGPLTSADAQMIHDLLNVNSPQNLARLLGWYGATFLAPILRHYYSQFPLLQVFGGASAGKSKTLSLLAHLHFHLAKPKITSASAYTPFALQAAAAASSSLPIYLEEMRQRLIGPTKWAASINILKSSYDGQGIERGGLGDKGQGAVVNSYKCSAPIVFVAEEQNGEVAIQERSVSVCMSEMDRYGRDVPYDRLLENAQDLGRVGKRMLDLVLALDLRVFRDEFNAIVAGIKADMGKARDGKDRPIFNLATTIAGLKLMQRAVQSACGDQFDEQFALMAASVSEHVEEFVPKNMSEASRVIDTMAQMTKVTDIQYKLEYGREYTVGLDGLSVDLKLKPAYAKYMKYARSLGTSPLYDSDQAFIAAMSRYGGVTSKACVDNDRLFGGPAEPVYRISTAFLVKEDVESFKA